jgi:uncharacterized protein
VGGFGSSLFFVPLASYFLDFHSVLGITAVYHVFSNLSKIAFFRQGFDKRLVLFMGIPSVLGVIGGSIATRYLPTPSLELALALFLVSISVVFLAFRKLVLPATNTNAIAGGGVSGFVAGLLGTGGAIRGTALAAFNLPIATFVATSAIIDLAVDASRTVVYYANGYMHRDDVYLIPILIVVSILGTFAGKKILERIPQAYFRNIVLVLILITGLITLSKVFLGKTA